MSGWLARQPTVQTLGLVPRWHLVSKEENVMSWARALRLPAEKYPGCVQTKKSRFFIFMYYFIILPSSPPNSWEELLGIVEKNLLGIVEQVAKLVLK